MAGPPLQSILLYPRFREFPPIKFAENSSASRSAVVVYSMGQYYSLRDRRRTDAYNKENFGGGLGGSAISIRMASGPGEGGNSKDGHSCGGVDGPGYHDAPAVRQLQKRIGSP